MTDDSGASLEAAIDDDPDDSAAYSVYGDWLQRRGDVRGELIALALAAEAEAQTPRRRAPARLAHRAFLTKHARTFLGALQRFVPDASDLAAPPFVWRRGFIGRAELRSTTAVEVRELLAHPSGRFVRELVLATEGNAAEIPGVLASIAPGSLRELELHGLVDLGQLDELWGRLARLQRLDLTGRRLELGELQLPALRRLRIAATDLSRTCVRSIARAPLSQLERLELRLGRSGPDAASFEDLRPLLHRTDLAALTHLKLKQAAYAGSIARALALTPLAAQLVVLDLSHGSLNPADIEVLVQHRERFAKLRELWLPLARLRDQDQRRAREITKHVISDARGPQDTLDDQVRDHARRHGSL